MATFRLFVSAVVAIGTACAQRVGAPTADLDKVSADELFSIQVTSVGRKAQELSKSPAAVFVLTAEDIRRSGATCIPEALQWVPGLTVLHVDGRSWVVSARGAARQYANKILVMIDGRSLYTPLFSGVIWDAVDVPMGDIEQIEVVRGPGAVMWGPNAMNGVINIITKSSKATKGGQLSVATGNELRASTEARWADAAGGHISYRVWGKFDYRTPTYGSPGYYLGYQGLPSADSRFADLDAGSGRMGFRVDGQSGVKDEWMLQGDLYKMDRQDPIATTVGPGVTDVVQGHSDYEGGYILGRWTHNASSGNESVLQFSYNKDNLNWAYLGAAIGNLNVDFQKRYQTGENNEIYLGAGFQQYQDDISAGSALGFVPSKSRFLSGDAVLRDEWRVVPGKWVVSAGIRIDYNSYRRVEYQPSFRLLYTPDAKQSAWIGISRAVRLPSRVERDIRFLDGYANAGPIPIQIESYGSESARSETERGLEAGYRFQSGQRWSVDASAFWSYYGKLSALSNPNTPELSFVGQTPFLQVPVTYGGFGTGRSYGGEIWATWQVLPGWRLIPSYSYLNESRWLAPSPADTTRVWDSALATVPHQALLRSQHDLSRTLKLDLMARVRSRDVGLNLPGALLVDARLSWRPTHSSEVSLAAQNLTDRRILEAYSEVLTAAIPIRRTFVIKWTQRF